MAFVFRAVDEVGATLNTALVVMGDKLGYYRALADARPAHAGRARRADRHRRALRPGVAQRPGGRRLRRLRPDDRPLHAAARAGGRAHRRDQPGVPARASSRSPSARSATPTASSTRPAPATASAGTSTTTTSTSAASGSSGPGYNAHLVAAWLPALDGVRRQAPGGRPGGRRRLRPRRVDDPDGAGVPDVAASSARTTTPARSRPPGSGPPTAGVADRVDASRSPRPTAFAGGPASTWSPCSTPARHGRPGRRRPARVRRRSPTTAPG